MMNRLLPVTITVLAFFCIAAMSTGGIQVQGPPDAKQVFIHSFSENGAVVSVLDEMENHISGLGINDFSVIHGSRKGKITSVTPLEAMENIPLNIVLVVDNSTSMRNRNAVKPLLNALEEFYRIVRPIDNIHAIVFDTSKNTIVKGTAVNARAVNTNNIEKLRSFFNESFSQRLTGKTYLYDSILAGLDIINSMPSKSSKLMLVMSDGEDINSRTASSELESMAAIIPNFSAYAVDFTEDTSMDYFLQLFAESNQGRIWKAESSSELVPIFRAFSNSLRHRYNIAYRFMSAPAGSVALEPATLIIEEVTTIDSSPLLNYVFFEEGQSSLSDEYNLFSMSDMTREFSTYKLAGPMDKYRNVLNIIGKRLSDNPDATIALTGCNSNSGPEMNNLVLSRSRADTVSNYLQTIWGIDRSRITVAARNLPQVPSSTKTAAGLAENRRVEIASSHPAILDTVKSTYEENIASASSIKVKPNIRSEAGIAKWKVALKGSDQKVIDSASGKGDIGSAVTFNLVPAGLSRIASFKTLTASVEVTDQEGVAFKNDNAAIANVKHIRKEAQATERKGQRILEKYALILFEYDKSALGENNKKIINRIVSRIKEIPQASVLITGHTDSIGTESYNMTLSDRRAKAVYDLIMASGTGSGKKISYTGAGLHNPLYDNSSPEGRALNRTVIVTLEYDEKS